MFTLQNKTIIITGGAGLIGSVFSRACAEYQANVVIVDIDTARGEALAEKIKEETKNTRARFWQCDITKDADVTRLIRDVLAEYSSIDALVNNAFPRNKNWGKKFEEVSYEDFCENVIMNLGGQFLITRETAKEMMRQKHGNIINIASIYGIFAPKFDIYEGTEMTSAVEYAAIKGGVVQLTRYLASYLGKHNIRVNAISPGGVLDNQDPRFVERYKEKVLLGKRMAKPDDLTGALLFLLSEASSYITGQNIVVDGGWHLA